MAKLNLISIVGIIAMFTVIGTGTLYYTNFKTNWDVQKSLNQDLRYLTVDYILEGGQTYILMQNNEAASGFSRWRIDNKTIKVYGDGKSLDAQIDPLVYYGSERLVALKGKKLSITKELNDVKDQRVTIYKNSKGEVGEFIETFTLPIDTESSMKWSLSFIPINFTGNKSYRVEYRFSSLKADKFEFWKGHTLILKSGLQISFFSDKEKVDSLGMSSNTTALLKFKPQYGKFEADPTVRIGPVALDYNQFKFLA